MAKNEKLNLAILQTRVVIWLEFGTESGKDWASYFSQRTSCPLLLPRYLGTRTALALGSAGQCFKSPPLAVLLLPAPHLPRLLCQSQRLAMFVAHVGPSNNLSILLVAENTGIDEDNINLKTWKLEAVLSLAIVTFPPSSLFCMGTCTRILEVEAFYKLQLKVHILNVLLLTFAKIGSS